MPDQTTDNLRFQLNLVNLASALQQDHNSGHAEASSLEGLMQVCAKKSQ
jgi:hypothetical protein